MTVNVVVKTPDGKQVEKELKFVVPNHARVVIKVPMHETEDAGAGAVLKPEAASTE